MSGVDEIRSGFVDFFRREGHQVVPSSPLVPQNDPTLMFTNSGMVQFKNLFTGLETRPYTTATTAQKCVRAGGKHNDLDNVGYTDRHHTFFEMLGNFSFGDYFKDHAIDLAWRLVTGSFGLPRDRLLVTVYSDDEEAAALWRKVAGLSDDRIIRIPTSANFWQMGDTGPCGPCSEIFYDHGPAVAGGPPGSPDEDGDRFVEIWNLVFMQYEQRGPGDRAPLPRPSIDTGMGLERVSAILQGVTSNYDIDLMQALIRAVAEATGVDPGGPQRASHRVIADHLRACGFLIADGVLPSNEGRGYVLRRIMRRAMRHAELLGAREPVLWRLVPALVREMGQAYPELGRAEALITETLKLEEGRFRKTLERGLALLTVETNDLGPGGVLPGETAFKLYDTFGFPLDLTQDALRERGFAVDTDGFDRAMARQRAEARAAWSGSGEAATETVWFGVRERVGATEFLGYETETAEGVVRAIVRDGAEVSSLAAGESGDVVLNQTPFYAESGGQVGDTGVMTGVGVVLDVAGTSRKLGALTVHAVTVRSGALRMDAALTLRVDHRRRTEIRANHSATHLLHEALRQVLGDHVAQKGSLVSDGRLRFDFSHPRALDEAEVTQVEDIANRIVLEDALVTTRLMGVEEAIASGARALFGEKYGDEWRVVSMGPVSEAGHAWSVELCGGTHAARTGEIGLISVQGETAVASGVRRIEALTRDAARHHLNEESRRARRAAGLLKAQGSDLVERVGALVEDRRKLEREVADARRKLALAAPDSAGPTAADVVNGVSYVGRILAGVSARELKSMVDDEKKKVGSGVIAFVTVDADGRASIVVGVTADQIGAHNAVDLVRAGAAALGGQGGGGRPDLAQAGGPDGSQAAGALSAVRSLIAGPAGA